MNKISQLLSNKEELLEYLKEIADEEGLDLEELTESVATQIVTLKDRAKAKAGELASQVDETAHDNPWPFIAIGAAAGFLAGYFIKMR